MWTAEYICIIFIFRGSQEWFRFIESAFKLTEINCKTNHNTLYCRFFSFSIMRGIQLVIYTRNSVVRTSCVQNNLTGATTMTHI